MGVHADTAALDTAGYAILPDTLPIEVVDRLVDAVSAASGTERHRVVYGSRSVLALPEVRALATSPVVRALVEPVLGPDCFAVRGLLFDKTPDANWKVVWHQDLTIAVRKRREVPGFGPWSVKDGIAHVQPPVSILERMLAVRLHLDDCEPENGPLRVLPGTHRHGRLLPDRIAQLRQEVPEAVCAVPRGGALLMRPLLLHASSSAASPGHRRVVHLEFAAGELPDGLQWYDRVR